MKNCRSDSISHIFACNALNETQQHEKNSQFFVWEKIRFFFNSRFFFSTRVASNRDKTRACHSATHRNTNRKWDWTRWIKINEFEIQSENFYWTRNLCGAKAKTAQSICFLSILVASCVWLGKHCVYTFESVRQKQHFEMYQIHLRFRSTNTHTHSDTHTSYREARAPMMMQWPQNSNTYERMSLYYLKQDDTCKFSWKFLFCCMVYGNQTTNAVVTMRQCNASTSN